MGSPSLKATSIGVALSDNTFHAARLASDAGSSGVVGIRPGIARGRAVGVVGERRVVGSADGLGHRAEAARLDKPPDLDLGQALDGLTETPPDVGHRQIAGGQSGVGHDDTSEAIRMLCGKPQPDQAAPVLADQRHPLQVQPVERERAHPLHVTGVGVVLDPGGLIRAAESDEVR